MSFDDSLKHAFLQELYNRTNGDFEISISMYDLGADLELGKDEVSALAQDLFIEGLAEMKTLSGGVGITQKGLEVLNISIAAKDGSNLFKFKNSPVLDEQEKNAVHELLNKIRAGISNIESKDSKTCSFDLLEEIVINIKTIEVQMLSPNPKTKIVKEVFKFLDQNLTGIVPNNLNLELKSVIS